METARGEQVLKTKVLDLIEQKNLDEGSKKRVSERGYTKERA